MARLKKVGQNQTRDRSAPRIEHDATVAAEVAEEEAEPAVGVEERRLRAREPAQRAAAARRPQRELDCAP